MDQIGGIIIGVCLIAPQKLTFGEMRSTGVRGILIYCSDYKPLDRDQRRPMA